LSAVFQQTEADADLALSFGFGTLRFEGALAALVAFVIAPVGHITVVGGIAGSIAKMQPLMGWTDKFIFVRVIAKVLRPELVFANDLGLAVVVRILVEGVVLDEVAHTVLL